MSIFVKLSEIEVSGIYIIYEKCYISKEYLQFYIVRCLNLQKIYKKY